MTTQIVAGQFDKMSAKCSIRELDHASITGFAELACRERRLDIKSDESAADILSKLELVKDDAITNAGVLLFGKNPQKHISQ